MRVHSIFAGGFLSGLAGAVIGAALFKISGKNSIEIITYTASGAAIASLAGWLIVKNTLGPK